jgi:hypothetical protein
MHDTVAPRRISVRGFGAERLGLETEWKNAEALTTPGGKKFWTERKRAAGKGSPWSSIKIWSS